MGIEPLLVAAKKRKEGLTNQGQDETNENLDGCPRVESGEANLQDEEVAGPEREGEVDEGVNDNKEVKLNRDRVVIIHSPVSVKRGHDAGGGVEQGVLGLDHVRHINVNLGRIIAHVVAQGGILQHQGGHIHSTG